jgi:hypothetical protein
MNARVGRKSGTAFAYLFLEIQRNPSALAEREETKKKGGPVATAGGN